MKIKVSIKNSKTKSQVSSLNMTTYEKNYIMCNLLNVLFDQVKLQQEVRDRWFGHYLTIIGALVALATLCLKLFENTVNKEKLYMFLGLMFVFAGLLGTLFFILYLCQRKNYKQTYIFLSLVQNEIISSMSEFSNKLYEKSTFVTKKHGADFYTLLIQNIIDSTIIAAGIVFILISQSVASYVIVIWAISELIVVFIALQLIRCEFEKKGDKKNEAK